MFLRPEFVNDSQEISSVDQNATMVKSSGADKQVTSAKKPEKPANIVWTICWNAVGNCWIIRNKEDNSKSMWQI